MEDINIVLANHEQKLAMLENEISELKSVQAEIRTMNETLVTLATELKHTSIWRVTKRKLTKLKQYRKCECSKL